MKKQFFIFVIVMPILCLQTICGQARYVFLFIGDGMGTNQINVTEAYLSAQQGERGSVSLLMTQFPVVSIASTFSANSDVTDSAAAGTALATGEKTNNGYIGVDPGFNPLETIAEKAKKAGRKVGVATTESINGATPAAFYAHQRSRNMYYEIAQDVIPSTFDFFGGSGIANRNKLVDNTDAPDIYPLIEKAGYFIAKGFSDYKANAGKSDKILLVYENWNQTDGNTAERMDRSRMLPEITEAAIEVLTRNNKKGFFVMLENSGTDGAGHNNDATQAVKEVMDLDEAVKVAYEFYKKHPKETLIVITADHETGGLTVGKGFLRINVLRLQQTTQSQLSSQISGLYNSKNGNIGWEDYKNMLTETLGFWKDVAVSWAHEKILRDAFEAMFANRQNSETPDFYALAGNVKLVVADMAGLAWSTGGHSANYVPVFAVGVGQDLFKGKMHTSDIPKYIMKAAKL